MLKLLAMFLLLAYAWSVSGLPPCVCARDYQPVCGSDGQTYSNPCMLQCARLADSELSMARPGACEQAPASCACTFEYKPVCGTDGTTYPNQCSLNCQKADNPLLESRYSGPCSEDISEWELPPCVCTRENKPVCGSDGVTYPNACMLRCSALTVKDLSLKSEGPCSDEDGDAEQPLVSSCACTRILQPVCGTDGVTYNNPCLLNCAAENKPVALQADGTCDETAAVYELLPPDSSCSCGRTYMPMCGSDGKTYPNPCTLRCSKKNNPKLVISYTGPCNGARMTLKDHF